MQVFGQQINQVSKIMQVGRRKGLERVKKGQTGARKKAKAKLIEEKKKFNNSDWITKAKDTCKSR